MTAIVFDFDQTLTAEHAFYALYTKKRPEKFQKLSKKELLDNREFLVDYIFGGSNRVEMLFGKLHQLIVEHGATLMISSHGFIHDIVDCLNSLQNMGFENVSLQMFRYIHGKSGGTSYNTSSFSVFDSTDGELIPFNKNKFFFLEEFVRPAYERCIIFADDDGYGKDQYYFKLQSTGYKNYHLIMVPKTGGLDPAAMDKIFKKTKKCEAQLYQILESCLTCGKEGTHICGHCRVTRYCSVDCQAQHWKMHKKFCK